MLNCAEDIQITEVNRKKTLDSIQEENEFLLHTIQACSALVKIRAYEEARNKIMALIELLEDQKSGEQLQPGMLEQKEAIVRMESEAERLIKEADERRLKAIGTAATSDLIPDLNADSERAGLDGAGRSIPGGDETTTLIN